jgi:cell division protein FtsL
MSLLDSIRRLGSRTQAREDDSRPQGVIRRRPTRAGQPKAQPHGFRRADDEGGERSFALFDRRRADGTPLLLFTVLAVLTGVGLARVQSRIEILDIANEITELSEDHQRLLDRKRRLETERAYLRRPERVAEQARERLGMQPAAPERIQRIELLPAKTLDNQRTEESP